MENIVTNEAKTGLKEVFDELVVNPIKNDIRTVSSQTDALVELKGKIDGISSNVKGMVSERLLKQSIDEALSTINTDLENIVGTANNKYGLFNRIRQDKVSLDESLGSIKKYISSTSESVDRIVNTIPDIQEKLKSSVESISNNINRHIDEAVGITGNDNPTGLVKELRQSKESIVTSLNAVKNETESAGKLIVTLIENREETIAAVNDKKEQLQTSVEHEFSELRQFVDNHVYELSKESDEIKKLVESQVIHIASIEKRQKTTIWIVSIFGVLYLSAQLILLLLQL